MQTCVTLNWCWNFIGWLPLVWRLYRFLLGISATSPAAPMHVERHWSLHQQSGVFFDSIVVREQWFGWKIIFEPHSYTLKRSFVDSLGTDTSNLKLESYTVLKIENLIPVFNPISVPQCDSDSIRGFVFDWVDGGEAQVKRWRWCRGGTQGRENCWPYCAQDLGLASRLCQLKPSLHSGV